MESADKARRRGEPIRQCRTCEGTYCTQGAMNCHKCFAKTGRISTVEEIDSEEQQTEGEDENHTNEETYGCSYCDLDTDDQELALRHQDLSDKLHEAGVAPKRCSTCEKLFCGRDTFKLHQCMPESALQLSGSKRRSSADPREGSSNKRSKANIDYTSGFYVRPEKVRILLPEAFA